MLGRSQTWISKFDPRTRTTGTSHGACSRTSRTRSTTRFQDTIVKNINSAYEGNQIAVSCKSALVWTLSMRHVVRWTTNDARRPRLLYGPDPQNGSHQVQRESTSPPIPLTTQGGTPFNKLGDQVGQGLVGTLAMLGAGLLFMNRPAHLALVETRRATTTILPPQSPPGAGPTVGPRWSASARATAGYTLRDTRGGAVKSSTTDLRLPTILFAHR